MFVVYCETCDTRTLMGIDEVEWVHNLMPGVISVTTACPRGHPTVVLTGDKFRPKADPRIPDRIPPLWVRAYRHPAKWWARLLGRLLRKYEIQRDLHEALYRF
ncbi:hypothetical protein L1857_01745 [Amycolatopsis thermalba]|uniref:Uncharacterized protein n=1 Tax=Amycolatopsis thermalba TaxID=944492 RepID=A0ABY4NQ85_9PSEU|nr:MULTISPECIES: hypothetical protein [Amycolatopsis]UQS21637.1 hypothetical protein L1857_01745 [Amycolatopsis thermalba]